MYKRLFVLGLERDKRGVIRTVKVLDESQLELELARIPNSIGCRLTAPKNMLKVFNLKDLTEYVKSGKVVLTNAEISTSGEFRLLDGYRVTEIVKDGMTKTIKGVELLQLIYKATVPITTQVGNRMQEVGRKVVVGCTIDGDIHVLDYTDYKPPELICESVVNCKCTVNNNNTVSVRRNNGDFRESDFHLSRVLGLTQTNSGFIFIDKRGLYYYVDNTTSTISKGSEKIDLDWFTNLSNVDNIRCIKGNDIIGKTVYTCKNGKVFNKIGVLKARQGKKDTVINIDNSGDVSKQLKKHYKVQPIFDVVDLVTATGLEDKECERHFDIIPDVNVMCVKLGRGSQFTKLYGITYLGTIYVPSKNKLLDLKYYSIRWHKTSSDKAVINAFYKSKSKSGVLSNFMDIVDAETGEIINTVELTEKLVDTLIDTYVKSITNRNRTVGRVGSNIKEVVAYKRFLKTMCRLDNRLLSS